MRRTPARLAAALLLSLALPLAVPAHQAAAVPSDFVYASGTQLMLDGTPWRAVGVNFWDMDAIKVYNNDLAGCYYQRPDLDRYFDESFRRIAAETGANVVRTFGFMSFYTGGGESWGATDKLIHYARKHNVRLIPVLAGHDDKCVAPAAKTAAWYHCSTPGCTPGYKQPTTYGISFRDYVVQVAGRYKDEPTIAFWQLLNESRSPAGAADPTALTDFSRDMVRAIRIDAGDTNHLVNHGTKGGHEVPRPQYGNLLLGDSFNCPATGTGGCNDLAEAHEFPNTVPAGTVLLQGTPFKSELDAYIVYVNAAGSECGRGGVLDMNADMSPTAEWVRLAGGVPACTASWQLRFTGPAGVPWRAYVDDVVVQRGTTRKLYTFETGDEGFGSLVASEATVGQTTRYARNGLGSLVVEALPGHDGTVEVAPPPDPFGAPIGDSLIEVRLRPGISAPVNGVAPDSLATSMQAAVHVVGKPYVTGELSITAEVPLSNPAYQVDNPFTGGQGCLRSTRTPADRAAAYERMFAFQLDDDHRSSGILLWDWKDPAMPAINSAGVPILDTNISCYSHPSGDPALAVVRKWAVQWPNDPPLPPPTALGSYPPAMFVPTPPPATLAARATAVVKARVVRDGGNPYAGVRIVATGGCSGSATSDALGWVSFTCTAVATPGPYTVTLAPDPATCGTVCPPGKSYALTVS